MKLYAVTKDNSLYPHIVSLLEKIVEKPSGPRYENCRWNHILSEINIYALVSAVSGIFVYSANLPCEILILLIPVVPFICKYLSLKACKTWS